MSTNYPELATNGHIKFGQPIFTATIASCICGALFQSVSTVRRVWIRTTISLTLSVPRRQLAESDQYLSAEQLVKELDK
jgi:hypothetical protein